MSVLHPPLCWSSRRAFLLAACLMFSLSASAQDRSGIRVAPAGGASLYLGDDDASVQSAVGADVAVGLAPRWDLGVGLRSVGRGASGDRLYVGSLAATRRLVARGPVRLSMSAGGLASRSSSDDGWGYGPQAGVALSVPVSRWGALAAGATISGVSRRTDGAPDRSFDGVLEATVGVRVELGRPVCQAPSPMSLTVPQTLLPYERGRFEWAMRDRSARVVWMFGDGVTAQGSRVEKAFTEPGTYGVRAVVERCATVHVVEATVVVARPCWEAPRVRVEASPSGVTVPFSPVRLRAVVEGTPPFRYRWRHAAGEDTTAAVTVAYRASGLHAIDLEVTNCTGETATARGLVEVQTVESSVDASFGFGRCDGQESRGDKPPPSVDERFNAAVLAGVALALRQRPEAVLLVEGFADSTAARYNPALSWGRALRVAEHVSSRLQNPGADVRIVIVGRGVDPTWNARQARLSIVTEADAQAAVALGVVGGDGVPMENGCPSIVDAEHWKTSSRTGLDVIR